MKLNKANEKNTYNLKSAKVKKQNTQVLQLQMAVPMAWI